MAMLDAEHSKDDFKETTTRMMLHLYKGTFSSFEWKDYCPAVFRTILELQNIDLNDYMKSICGEENLLSPGKCGTAFVSSLDDRLVIKMLRKDELTIMLEILPNYYRHLRTYKSSLLSKLYGLHYVRPHGGVKVYFAVTCNVMKSTLQIHRCFDLKGATGRSNLKRVTENLCVGKDEDFDFSFYLDPFLRSRLLQQIKYDCEFLEAEGIMDYSFLLGIHTDAQHEGLLNCKRSIGGGSFSSGRSSAGMLTDTSEGNYDAEFSFAYLCSPSESGVENFGIEMPAVAMQTPKNADAGVRAEEYYDVVLNFSIVDIFQSYNMMKRIEHVYKSLQHPSRSIGAVNPKAYSCRFQDFLKRVFQSTDSISSHFDNESMSTSSRQSV